MICRTISLIPYSISISACNTHTWVADCPVARVDDGAVQEDCAAQLPRRVGLPLRPRELGLGRLHPDAVLGQEEPGVLLQQVRL